MGTWALGAHSLQMDPLSIALGPSLLQVAPAGHVGPDGAPNTSEEYIWLPEASYVSHENSLW